MSSNLGNRPLPIDQIDLEAARERPGPLRHARREWRAHPGLLGTAGHRQRAGGRAPSGRAVAPVDGRHAEPPSAAAPRRHRRERPALGARRVDARPGGALADRAGDPRGEGDRRPARLRPARRLPRPGRRGRAARGDLQRDARPPPGRPTPSFSARTSESRRRSRRSGASSPMPRTS